MKILILIISYLCGSLPFSFIVPWLKGVDIRKVGSGNIGGTNVLRALGPKYGAICISLDFLKSFVPVFVARMIFGINSWIPYLCLIFAVLGHNYSIFLKFKGGKGVSSTLGGYFALRPLLGIIFLIVWFPVELATKYVSLASLLGMLISAIMGFFIDVKAGITFLILFLFSAYKHRTNIKRLIEGTENKTDFLSLIKKGHMKSE